MRWPANMCFLCGSLRCACGAHTNPSSINGRYAVCDTCLTGLMRRCGNVVMRRADNVHRLFDPVADLRGREAVEFTFEAMYAEAGYAPNR